MTFIDVDDDSHGDNDTGNGGDEGKTATVTITVTMSIKLVWWPFPRLRGFWEVFFFFEVEISSRTLIPLFIPGSVHSDSAN